MAAEIPTRDIVVWSGTSERLISNKQFEASLLYKSQPKEISERQKLMRIGIAKVLEHGKIKQLVLFAEKPFLLDVVWGEQYRRGQRWIRDAVPMNADQIPLDDQGHVFILDGHVNPEFSEEALMTLLYHALRWLRTAALNKVRDREGLSVLHHVDPAEWHDESSETKLDWRPDELKGWETDLEGGAD